jgi:hypothetical protein
MRTYIEFNALQFYTNLPLTLLTQVIVQDQEYYMLITIALFFNKVIIDSIIICYVDSDLILEFND